MVDIQSVCDEWFGGCKPKYLKSISYTTPRGNTVEALICRKPNKFLGSLFIFSVNGESVEQFVPSMPKIHYFDDYHQPSFSNGVHYDCMEKLDGTCVILYPLLDKNGDVLEIVPKSRNMGVLDDGFLKKYRMIDTLKYEEYLMKNPSLVLLFELYGMGNLHSIEHMDTYLDLAFLGCFYNGELYQYMYYFANDGCRKLFDVSFDNGEYSLSNRGLWLNFYPYVELGLRWFSDFGDCVKEIQAQLEKLNESYFKVNNRLAIEGVVLNYRDSDGFSHYLKIKPSSIELEHRSEGGVPRQFIMKELMKYLDEYGSVAKEEYEKSPDHYLSYMYRMLGEEFNSLSIDKSRGKMINYLEKKLYPPIYDDEIVNICENLIKENQGLSITDYMRLFGQQNPFLKRKSRLAYNVFSEKLL